MLYLPIILTYASCALAGRFNTILSWKYMSFLWESEEQRISIHARNQYDPTAMAPFDAIRVRDKRIFVTTPARVANATPATLSTVSKYTGPSGPLLAPYPHWGWHNATNCKGITSVWQIDVDEYDRLWVLDCGKIAMETICPPQYLVFDLKTDKLVRRYVIPDSVAQSPQNPNSGWLSHPAVISTGKHFEKTRVIASHTVAGGLIVLEGEEMWRREDDIFRPPQKVVNYMINGVPWNAPNGMLRLAITPKTSANDCRIFFKGLASLQLNSVLLEDVFKSSKTDICSTTSMHRFDSAITAQSFSKDGTLFYGLAQETAIGCWNSKTTLDKDHVDIVAQDSINLQWASAVRVIPCADEPFEEEVFAVTNRLHIVVAGNLNLSDTNFRILVAPVKKLIKGSKCGLSESRPPSLIKKILAIIGL